MSFSRVVTRFTLAAVAATSLALTAAPTVVRADDAPPPASAPAAVPPAADAPKARIDWSARLAVPITHDVRDACDSTNANDLAYCYGVIMEAYDANFFLADAVESEPLCIPKSATPDQLRQAFLAGAKAQPDQLKGPFAIFFYSVMAGSFPCAPGIRSTPQPAHGLNPGNNTK